MENNETNNVITVVFGANDRLLLARKDSYNASINHTGREIVTHLQGIYYTSNNDGLDKNITSYQDSIKAVAQMAKGKRVVEFRIGTLAEDGEVTWDKEQSTPKELKSLIERLEKSGNVTLNEEAEKNQQGTTLSEKQKNVIFDKIINKEMQNIRREIAQEGYVMQSMGVKPNIAEDFMNKSDPVREADLRGQAPTKKVKEEANKAMNGVVLEFERLKEEGKIKIERVAGEQETSTDGHQQQSPKTRLR